MPLSDSNASTSPGGTPESLLSGFDENSVMLSLSASAMLALPGTTKIDTIISNANTADITFLPNCLLLLCFIDSSPYFRSYVLIEMYHFFLAKLHKGNYKG
jgi:hypothetical protein